MGLLIGYCYSASLVPLQIVVGSESKPFAQKTELGWSIIGATNPHLDRPGGQRYVHRVTVKELPAPAALDVSELWSRTLMR